MRGLQTLTDLVRTDLVSLFAVVRGIQTLTDLERNDLVEFVRSEERHIDPH